MASYSIVFAESELAFDPRLQAAIGKLEGTTLFPALSSDVVKEVLNLSSRTQQRFIFVTKDFNAPFVKDLKKKCWILGPPAFIHYADTVGQIPRYNLARPARPQYNFSMEKVVAYFSGYKNVQEDRVTHLVNLIHYMGGKVLKQMMSPGKPFIVNHLISQWVEGENYRIAVNFAIPIISDDWIEHFWTHRDEALDAMDKQISAQFHIKPFHGLRLFFIGFDEVESLHNIVQENGGEVVDSAMEASHIVLDSENKAEKRVTWEELGNQRMVTLSWTGFSETIAVTREQQWFWTCVWMDNCADANAYDLLKTNSSSSTRSVDRKRKTPISPRTPSRKRLSVVTEREASLAHASFDRSDESLHSSSEILGSSQTYTKRHQTVEEMVKTETNYIKTLSDILKIKEDAAVEQNGKPIYDTDAARQMDEYMKMIPDILDLHTVIHRELECLIRPWHEDASVGKVWLKYGDRLESCYPPYVNLIEKLKKHIEDCEKRFPKFRAHLLLAQMKPEYGRHHLKDLLVRPVQRLASVDVLLTDIRKATQETNPDFADLTRAKAEVQRVLTFINKKKQVAEVEEMLADIDEAPVDLLSGHGEYISHIECYELSSRQFCDKGANLSLLLFADVLMVTKRRFDRRFQNKPDKKPLKLLELIPLMRIKKITDVSDGEDQQVRGAFVLSFMKESADEVVDYKFAVTCEYLAEKKKKRDFLTVLRSQVLASDCTADPLLLLRDMSADEVGIKRTDTPSSTWTRSGKLSRTVSRLSSFGRSGTKKMTRALSSAFLTPTSGKKAIKAHDDSDSDATPQRMFNKRL